MSAGNPRGLGMQVNVPNLLREFRARLRALEANSACDGGTWAYVDPISPGEDDAGGAGGVTGTSFENGAANLPALFDEGAFNALFSAASYIKDCGGTVMLRGHIDTSALTGSVLFTLPVGFRPAMSQRFICATDNGCQVATVDVLSDGSVVLVGCTGGL